MAEGGQPKYLRELSTEVRNLTLREIRDILLDQKHEVHSKEFRQQVILKLASNVLPRINEHSGPEGGAIEFTPIYNGQSISKYNCDEARIQPKE